MLEAGSTAPDFKLATDNFGEITLSQFRGKRVILYFYPKDDTPGCTKEACSLRDNFSAISEKNAVVIGVSPDGEESHQKFRDKFDLPFYLGSDPDKSVMTAYGAWGEKNMYGKKSMGVIRSTFIIDENGVITKVFKRVKTETHGLDVQQFL